MAPVPVAIAPSITSIASFPIPTLHHRKSSLRGNIPLPQGPRLRSNSHSAINRSFEFQLSASSPYSSSSLTLVATPDTSRPSSADKSIGAASSISTGSASCSSFLALIAESSPTRSPPTFANVGVQASPPSTSTFPSSSPSSVSSTPTSTSTSTSITFDPVPITWKGISLEEAQSAFTPIEIQEIVSRAIRLSAQASFIQLLSLETLDRTLVGESERLGKRQKAAQTEYKSNIQRRSTLLRTLRLQSKSRSTDNHALALLAAELCEIATACDALTTELVRIENQQAQICKLRHLHLPTALAIKPL